jgi:hypothetical protein
MARITYQVYPHLLLSTSLFLSFLPSPLNLKYLQCWSGPALLPVSTKNSGTPTNGMKFSGKNSTNSAIWRKLNGP